MIITGLQNQEVVGNVEIDFDAEETENGEDNFDEKEVLTYYFYFCYS